MRFHLSEFSVATWIAGWIPEAMARFLGIVLSRYIGDSPWTWFERGGKKVFIVFGNPKKKGGVISLRVDGASHVHFLADKMKEVADRFEGWDNL